MFEPKTFVSAVLLCAGRSERMGADINKQFLRLDGFPVAHRSIAVFDENRSVDEIIVVASKDRLYAMERLVEEANFQKVTKIIAGGDCRTASSRIGVSHTASEAEVVLIHDGARPLVDDLTIERVLKGVNDTGAAAPGLWLKETVKQVDAEHCVFGTLDRTELCTIQTPQGFKKELYLRATQNLEDKASLFDDCQLVEAVGGQVKIVQGSEFNLKITTPEDILLAEAICHMKREMEYTCESDKDMMSMRSKRIGF